MSCLGRASMMLHKDCSTAPHHLLSGSAAVLEQQLVSVLLLSEKFALAVQTQQLDNAAHRRSHCRLWPCRRLTCHPAASQGWLKRCGDMQESTTALARLNNSSRLNRFSPHRRASKEAGRALYPGRQGQSITDDGMGQQAGSCHCQEKTAGCFHCRCQQI